MLRSVEASFVVFSGAYIATNTYHAVSLDYVGNKLAMLIVLPKAGNDFVTLANNFELHDFRTALSGLETTRVNISLP